MRALWQILVVLLIAGCLGSPTTPGADDAQAHKRVVHPLKAPGANTINEGPNVTFEWKDSLGAGAEASLATGAALSQFDHKDYKVPVD